MSSIFLCTLEYIPAKFPHFMMPPPCFRLETVFFKFKYLFFLFDKQCLLLLNTFSFCFIWPENTPIKRLLVSCECHLSSFIQCFCNAWQPMRSLWCSMLRMNVHNLYHLSLFLECRSSVLYLHTHALQLFGDAFGIFSCLD